MGNFFLESDFRAFDIDKSRSRDKVILERRDTGSTLSLFPFIPCAVIISVFAICVSVKYFGRKEMS